MASLNPPDSGHQESQTFNEKGLPQLSAAGSREEESNPPAVEHDVAAKLPVPSKLREINNRIENLAGFEARGIARVLPEERQPPSRSSDLQVAIMWYSANISLNNLAAAMLGPLAFQLGFLDCAMCAVFGAFVGSLTTAYMSIWGPQSGNRTMVSFRFLAHVLSWPTAKQFVTGDGNVTSSTADQIANKTPTALRSSYDSSWDTGPPRFCAF